MKMGNEVLEKCIMEARRALNEHHQYLIGNETATRIMVVDVVLGALGWNVRNPSQVGLEHRVNGNKIDHVLLASSGDALAIVEAKSANLGLKDSDRRQASGYAREIGAR